MDILLWWLTADCFISSLGAVVKIVRMRGVASPINPFHYDHQAIVRDVEARCLPQDPVTGCILLDSTSKLYVRWKFTNLVTGDDNDEHYVHRMYFACKNLVALENNQSLHVSHLCHMRKCLSHLSYEPASLNRFRAECAKARHCYGHDGFLPCHLV